MLLLDKSLKDKENKNVYFLHILDISLLECSQKVSISNLHQSWLGRLKNPKVADMKQHRGAKFNRDVSRHRARKKISRRS